MEQGSHEQRHPDLGDVLAHLALRGDDVGDHIGNRSVVADRAGENDRNLLAVGFVHDAAREDAGVDRGLDPAERADPIDRAQVVHVPLFHGKGVGQVHAERRPEELRLDIVGGQRVSGEQRVDEAVSDQTFQVFAGARVDDRRTADEQDPFALFVRALQFARDFGDQRFLGLLARNGRGHEFKDLLAPRPLNRMRANAGVPHDDRLAGQNVGRRDRSRTTLVDDDRTVHLRKHDGKPATIDSHLGFEVGGRVELIGKHARGRRRLGFDVAVVGHDRTDVAQFVEQFRHDGARLGLDAQARGARLGDGLADGEVVDRVASELVIHDDFEDAPEQTRVEDVPAQLDFANQRSAAVFMRRSHWG